MEDMNVQNFQLSEVGEIKSFASQSVVVETTKVHFVG